MWDDSVTELKRDFSLLNKKMGALKTKVEDMNYLTNHFHEAAAKAETQYMNDSEMRKKYY